MNATPYVTMLAKLDTADGPARIYVGRAPAMDLDQALEEMKLARADFLAADCGEDQPHFWALFATHRPRAMLLWACVSPFEAARIFGSYRWPGEIRTSEGWSCMASRERLEHYKEETPRPSGRPAAAMFGDLSRN